MESEHIGIGQLCCRISQVALAIRYLFSRTCTVRRSGGGRVTYTFVLDLMQHPVISEDAGYLEDYILITSTHIRSFRFDT